MPEVGKGWSIENFCPCYENLEFSFEIKHPPNPHPTWETTFYKECSIIGADEEDLCTLDGREFTNIITFCHGVIKC